MTKPAPRRESPVGGVPPSVARNLDRADDLFGGPQGSPRTDKMIAAAVQWAELIMGSLTRCAIDSNPLVAGHTYFESHTTKVNSSSS